MTRGRFITFEGGEGVGKSTQIALLADALTQRGIDLVKTREPGGTAGAEAIRTLLLDREKLDWNATSEALLFAAARSDHVALLIVPALDAGKWVLCDRFIDSTRAYQGGGGGVTDEDILALHKFGSAGLLPDCTLLLSLSASDADERLALRDAEGSDRIGGKDSDYHAAVARRFEQMAESEPARFAEIDAAGTPGEVHARVMSALAPMLELQE